jgi:radical SAM superfamily enzyme YgiQ (UPF0313 family)
MKVLFTYYPLYIRYNYACALLSAICKEHGIETKIASMDRVEKTIKYFIPDYIGISYVTKWDYAFSLPFIEYFLKPMSIPLMAGGVYLRLRGSTLPSLDIFDFICTGEGEILPDFLLHGDMTVFDTQYRCENISDLPLPDYSDVDLSEFCVRNPIFRGMKIIPYESSRGCPHQCDFCQIKKQSGSNKVRFRKTISADLAGLRETFKPDLIQILDEQPPYHIREWREQLEGNITPLSMYLRADIKEDELTFLFNNGLKYCAFGVEAGDEEYRNQVLKKNLSDEQLFSTIDFLGKFNIRFMAFFMVGGPGEDSAIRKKTMEMSERIRKLGGYPVVSRYEDLCLLQANEGLPATPPFSKANVEPLYKLYLPRGLSVSDPVSNYQYLKNLNKLGR